MPISICKGELHRLGDSMDISRRIVPHRFEIETVRQHQRLSQNRTACAWSETKYVEPAEWHTNGRLQPRTMRCHILHREEPVILAVIVGDRFGNVALIESIVGGPDTRFSAFTVPGSGFVGHVLQGFRQIGLLEDFPDPRRPIVRQIYRNARRPAAKRCFVGRYIIHHLRIHRETLAGKADRRSNHVSEPHRTVAFQRKQPGSRRTRRQCPLDALGNVLIVAFNEQFRPNRLWPGSDAVDGQNRIRSG